jgi:hypothetical protein
MSDFDRYYEELRKQTTDKLGTYLFCCSLSIIWAIYIIFFNSRLVGYIVTTLINVYLKRYYKNVHMQIRSISISILSGKIMFRDLHYITLDHMLYAQDGWITFAYWRSPFIKEAKKTNGLEQSCLINTSSGEQNKDDFEKKKNARLEVFMTNFQLHFYNSHRPEYANKPSGVQHMSNTNENNGGANLQETGDFTQDLMDLFSIVNIRIKKGKYNNLQSTLRLL